MAADLTVVPWDRLAKLAPPATTGADLQTAADRYALTADVYRAAADLWEDAAMQIDLEPDANPEPGAAGTVKSVAQDGINVTYADTPVTNTQAARISQYGRYMSTARSLRARSKVKAPLVHSEDYDPWRNKGYGYGDEDSGSTDGPIIPVD